MSRVASLACLLLAASCGGSNHGLAGDAGPSSTDGAGGRPAIPTSCTLPTQDPCGAAEQCSPFCDGEKLVVACRAEPATPAAIGETCGPTVVCGRGGVCLAASNIPVQCVKLCATIADCPPAKACREVHVTFPCSAAASEMVTLRACL